MGSKELVIYNQKTKDTPKRTFYPRKNEKKQKKKHIYKN